MRSSVARRLGMDVAGLVKSDRHVDGVVEMMLDATERYDVQLTAERLFGWHAALFPTGRSGMSKITVGDWRKDDNGPMQVVSGAIGHERVHYEAPKAPLLDGEMRQFLDWFNGFDGTDLILRAGIAHLWFVTIHPFEDGNGRIARAIADMALARSEKTPQRFYSMSAQIRDERNDYYDILKAAQKDDLDITQWLDWFLGCLGRAFEGANETLAGVLAKAKFWEKHRKVQFNERQKLMLNKLLNGFEGKLTSSKWAKIAKCSQDTASRDIEDLVKKRILQKTQPVAAVRAIRSLENRPISEFFASAHAQQEPACLVKINILSPSPSSGISRSGIGKEQEGLAIPPGRAAEGKADKKIAASEHFYSPPSRPARGRQTMTLRTMKTVWRSSCRRYEH